MLLKPREALALSASGTVTASLVAHKSMNAKRNTHFWGALEYCKNEFMGSGASSRDSSNKLELLWGSKIEIKYPQIDEINVLQFSDQVLTVFVYQAECVCTLVHTEVSLTEKYGNFGFCIITTLLEQNLLKIH